MSLRTKILIYLIALHVVMAGAAWLVLSERRGWLFAVESLFLVSVVVSVRLARALFVPLDLVRTGAELIAERDFTSRLAPVGEPEMDTLIEVYNRMIDRLREERLAAEERHQLLAKIVEASPAGIVLCDFDGVPERMNPAARDLLPKEALAERLLAVPMGESRLVSEGARRLKISRAEFRDRGFAKSFFVIEEMTEELRLSERHAYEKLIRMMSHEVNNSVGAVRSLLESALGYAPQVGDADRGDLVSALTIASERMDALNRFMRTLADVVRIPPPAKAPACIADLVLRVAALFRPELEERGIRIDLDLADRSEYDVDAAQIEQVVVNALRNAMEAVGRDGLIRISFRDGVLRLIDSGPGISEAVRQQLFTPFFTTKRDGRGLGLTIIHDILANHGFPFTLQNHPSGGAELRVTFR